MAAIHKEIIIEQIGIDITSKDRLLNHAKITYKAFQVADLSPISLDLFNEKLVTNNKVPYKKVYQ